MAKKRKQTDEYTQSNIFMIAVSSMLLLFVYLLICLYPFLLTPGYGETSYVKYGFLVSLFFGVDVGPLFIPTFIPLSIICIIIGTALYLKSNKIGIKEFLRQLRFSSTDIMVALYGLFVIISTITTPYRENLIWGATMSFMGLASQFLFIYIYFITSRLFDLDELKGVLYMSLLSSALVFIIGILQRFGLDIFNLYDGLENKLFISTIGQHTFFSAYLILFYVLGAYMVWITDPGSLMHKVAILHLVISSCLPCILNADMIFSGLFFTLSFLFILSFDSMERMKAFFEISLVILITWRIIGILWIIIKPEFRLEPLPKFIMQSPLIWIPTVLILVIYILIRRMDGGKNGSDISKYRWIGHLYAGFVGAAMAAVIIYIILNTAGILPESLRSQANYLLFDPFWGNGRGAIWHDTVMSFIKELKDAPVTAVFGAGQDRYVDVIDKYVHEWIPIYSDKVALYAHNEWLNAFINSGIFGGIAYLGIFISACVRYVRSREKKLVALGAAVLIVSYLSHQFFGYQQYISTPYIFLALGIGEQEARNA